MRGSGVAGLRGIARRRWLGETLLLRPLLDFSRARLETYANDNEIAWFNDPSNQNLRFDRNYLRSQVMPMLGKRWPAYAEAFTSSCEIQAETQALLDEIAAQDYAKLQITDPAGDSRIDLGGLLRLSQPRQKNLIRHWIEMAELEALPHARLQQLLLQMQSRVDALPEIAMPGYSIRVYDQQLFLVRNRELAPCSGDFDFGQQPVVEIKTLDMRLAREEIFTRLEIEDRGQSLMLRFRQQGEPNPDSHRLKRLFQRHRVPPWERDGTAQVYLDGRLEGLLL